MTIGQGDLEKLSIRSSIHSEVMHVLRHVGPNMLGAFTSDH